jgi:hypothetical protein
MPIPGIPERGVSLQQPPESTTSDIPIGFGKPIIPLPINEAMGLPHMFGNIAGFMLNPIALGKLAFCSAF